MTKTNGTSKCEMASASIVYLEELHPKKNKAKVHLP